MGAGRAGRKGGLQGRARGRDQLFPHRRSIFQGISEEVTGRALGDMARRDEFVVSTKVATPMGEMATQRGLSRKHIMEAIDASLMRLGLDYVDLYVCHRWDETTPIEETLAALDDVVGAGKALYIGASNFTAWQLAKALGTIDRGQSSFSCGAQTLLAAFADAAPAPRNASTVRRPMPRVPPVTSTRLSVKSIRITASRNRPFGIVGPVSESRKRPFHRLRRVAE